jgi:sulfide:quinone oxidoreductase
MERFRVVIAGGGVAGLEALLALRELCDEQLDITLLAPEEEFHYRPLAIAEPFDKALARGFPLRQITREQHAHFRHASLERVEPESQTAITATGAELSYEALLVAIGVRAVESLPGSFTFRGSQDRAGFKEVLDEAERGKIRRLVFAMPRDAAWPLPLYELALLTADRVASAGTASEIYLQTPERRPLEMFGPRASAAVGALLEQAGVSLHLGRAPVAFDRGQLELSDGDALECDLVVSLPAPEAPKIPGIPQRGPQRLVPTNGYGKANGPGAQYAAGDITSFPIKQGGLAAQQADAAASAIAAMAGVDVVPRPFRPVLRGALITAHGPRYLRARSDNAKARPESVASRSVLWWPPAKIAGRLLAPYLAEKAGYPATVRDRLADLEAPIGDDPASFSGDHEDVVRLALQSADATARWRDFRGAMRWLEVAEDLELYLPTTYDAKRVTWNELAQQEVR